MKSNPENPFGMKDLALGGYAQGPELCTHWRKEYLRRGNRILAAYSMALCYTNIGSQHVVSLETSGQINTQTAFRLSIGERFIQCNYGQLKPTYNEAVQQLSNQAFLMVYGNLEAYLVDILNEAFVNLGSSDPSQDALNMMARAKWEGKIDSMCQRFKLELGKGQFAHRFRDIKMTFLGESFNEPIRFLQRIAEVRHLLVHSAGRLGDRLVQLYPEAGFTKDTVIAMPLELSFDLHIFLTAFSEVFDKAFSDKLAWTRTIVQPEQLVSSYDC
jgi:hypothetical protein